MAIFKENKMKSFKILILLVAIFPVSGWAMEKDDDRKNGGKDGFFPTMDLLPWSVNIHGPGSWKGGKNDGYCTYNFADGDKYVGECVNGEFHGTGTRTSISGYTYKSYANKGFTISLSTTIMTCYSVVSIQYISMYYTYITSCINKNYGVVMSLSSISIFQIGSS